MSNEKYVISKIFFGENKMKNISGVLRSVAALPHSVSVGVKSETEKKYTQTETHFWLVGGALNIESKLHQSPIKQFILVGINVSI